VAAATPGEVAPAAIDRITTGGSTFADLDQRENAGP
jgi:hypothetical protein